MEADSLRERRHAGVMLLEELKRQLATYERTVAYLKDKIALTDDEITCDRNPVDAKPESRELERVREWAHGTQGMGERCPRSETPIYTNPNEVPSECDRCNNNEWFGRGFVTREKDGGKVIDREWDRHKA